MNLYCGYAYMVVLCAFYGWMIYRVTLDIIEERQTRKRDKMARKGP